MNSHSTLARIPLQALTEADPALAALALWCVHRDGEATRTAGDVITYGPDFAAKPLHEQIGVAAHHILHVALRHPARLAGFEARYGAAFDSELYNLVADAVVNETLLLADHALPRPAVTLVDVLKRGLGLDVSPDQALANWDVDRLYHALNTPSQADGQKDGRRRDLAKAFSFAADLEPTPGGGAEGDVQQAAQWRQHLSRAMDAGRQAGRGIGRFGHKIADIPAPVTPWEVILRRLLAKAVMTRPQPSPQRPARRWIAGLAEAEKAGTLTPGFEPGMRPLTDVPRIAVALDASGSIDDARLALFWAEVTGIARRMRAELHLLVFDDAIRHHARIDPAAQTVALPDLPRGGGTDFRPVIIEGLRLRAAALVVLTDLDGPAGVAPRGLPVIWALPDGVAAMPPFGRLINMAA